MKYRRCECKGLNIELILSMVECFWQSLGQSLCRSLEESLRQSCELSLDEVLGKVNKQDRRSTLDQALKQELE